MSGMGTGMADLPLERLYRWERERGARPFLTQPWAGGVRTWTWAQAADEVRRVAAWLKVQDWPPGSHIGIVSRNCAWWILADLAIWMAGHVSVPVYPSLRASSIRHILDHTGAVACFEGAADEDPGIPADVSVIRLPTAPAGRGARWHEIVRGTPPLRGFPTREGGEVATIIYTSGTTGVPKGAVHTFAGFGFCGWTLSEVFKMADGQRFMSYLPLAHIFERGALEAPAIHLGAQIFFTAGLDTFPADVQRARPTVFLSVPRVLYKLQDGVFKNISRDRLDRLLRVPMMSALVKQKILRRLGLNAVRCAASGGAPLPVEILLWYRGIGLNLAEGYGATETMITHVPPTGRARPGYVGPPVPGVEQKLGAGGEILIRSPMNARGYYMDPDATREAFTPDGFYRTGDVGEIAPDGQLKITGRIKEQFKTSRGKYVVPGPIECKLAAHPAVESCCVMGSGQAKPFAVVVLSQDARERCAAAGEREALEGSLAAMLDHVNEQVEAHERIAFIAIADGPWSIHNGLLTPTFKLKRAALEAAYQDLAASWVEQARPVVWETAPRRAAGAA